jgi:hypothetical protein
MGYAWGWLIKTRGEAETAETDPKSTNLSFDEWCSKTYGFRTTAEINTKTEDKNFDIIKVALAEPRFFSEKYRVPKMPEILEEINKEIAYIESCMNTCETCSFGFKGFSLYNRVPGLKVDWRYNNFVKICNDTGVMSTSPVTFQDVPGRQSTQWTAVDYQNMDNAILGIKDRAGNVTTPGYIHSFSTINSITKAAVEVWWMYFKKLYRLKAVERIISRKCGVTALARQAQVQELEDKQKATIAGAHYNFIGAASSNLNPTPAPQPIQPAVQQAPRQSWKSWFMGKIFNKWTVGLGATAVAVTGLVKYGPMLFHSEPDLGAYVG